MSDMNSSELYDRQTRTYGKESIEKFNSGNVYIFGIERGLGPEVIKNIALTGIKNINIFNDFNVTKSDIKDSYFYKDSDLNKVKTDVIIDYIKDLNPSINIDIFYDMDIIKDNSIIVFLNYDKSTVFINSDKYRNKNCKIIISYQNHYSGFVFVDVGDKYVITHENDFEFENIQVNDIKDGTVYLNNTYLKENDIIVFKNLQGNIECLKNKEFKIYNVTKDSFQIIIDGEYNFENGFIEYVKQPTIITHKSFHKEIDNKTILSFDPDTSNTIINNLIKNVDTRNEFYPVTSVIGSVVASEIVKLVNEKYTPISQWFEFHDNDLKDIDIEDFKSKSEDNNILMVGCGALGCEWLKNLSMLGIKHIDITDPDHIEISNLSRQFLFRSQDVKKSKSKTAVDSIKKFNKNFNARAYEFKISEKSKQINECLFQDKNIIINALDNINARKYVDTLCFEKNLPLFESGTMGMKGNTQPIIPFLTETYSDSNDPVEKTFPICTIKNFPNQIEHTIHWARDYFELFNRAFDNINNYKKDKTYLDNLSDYDRNQAIRDINMFCSQKYDDYVDVLNLVKNIFDKEYYKDIKQLLHCYPEDHKVNGINFWSNGKRCPKIFDCYHYTNIIEFMVSTTHLLCKCMDIEDDFIRDEIMVAMLDFRLPEFEPDETIKIAKNDTEMKEMKETFDDKLNDTLYFRDNYYSQEFEKDDITNWHMQWITSASNCRAEVYSIEPINLYDTKGIAGKIIPAVATTTSLIVGLISIEYVKYTMGIKDLDKYKSYFVNLSDNTIIGAEPVKAKTLTIGNKEYNQWLKLEYKNCDISIEEFINHFNKVLDTNIETICHGSSIIYSSIMGGNLDKKLSDEIKENTTDKIVNLIVMPEDDIELPTIKVYL
jgi:ubiquitin-activating enzyme E1